MGTTLPKGVDNGCPGLFAGSCFARFGFCPNLFCRQKQLEQNHGTVAIKPRTLNTIQGISIQPGATLDDQMRSKLIGFLAEATRMIGLWRKQAARKLWTHEASSQSVV